MQLKESLSTIEQELNEVDQSLLNFIKSENERLQTIISYLVRAGGKRIRPAFTLLAAKFGKDSFEKAIPLAAAFELIHMATLIHDDVIDRSELRRGKPTIKALYGNNVSVHAGSFIFAKALNIIEKYKNPQISYLLTKASVEICQGEIAQLDFAFNPDHNIREYLYKIRKKTSLLITLSCQAGALATDTPREAVRSLGRYGHYVGMAYQIMDDILDYVAEEGTLGKPVGSDLQQGLLTLPAIYVLQKGDCKARAELKKIISKKELNEEDICRAVELVKKTQAIDYSQAIANKYVKKSVKELERLPANDAAETLQKIALFVKNRKY